MELDQKELNLVLGILKFQCDPALDGNFNKKLNKIDNQLLNIGSNRRTIDILNDLLVKLPNVIDTIKNIEMLNNQAKMLMPVIEGNKKVKAEMINEDKIVCRRNQQLKNPKPENLIYSSSENEEESEEETEDKQDQQSSFSSYKNCVQKVEKNMEEETVEIVPEVRKMSLDEIETLAILNAKRNKRIRYFSSDSEDENNNKKKKKKRDSKSSSVEKIPTKKHVENSQEINSTTISNPSILPMSKNNKIIHDQPKKSIKNALEERSVKLLEIIKDGQSFNIAHDRNIGLFAEIQIDRYLIAIAESYWFRTGQEWTNIEKWGDDINHRIDWEIKDFKVLCSSRLQKALIPIFEKAFGNEIPGADTIFSDVVSHTMDQNKLPRIMDISRKSVAIWTRIRFLETVKNITSNRMKFLEFVKNKSGCNYEI